MPKSRKANFRSKRAQTKKRGKRMGGKRMGRKMGRRLQKGGIHGFHDGDITPYERAMENFMVEKLGIKTDSMDWWDITCIDLRKNMKYIYEYHELKKKNGGDFSDFWLTDYKKKLSNLKPFDLTAPLGKTDMNTCGYTQKCVQTTDDKLNELSNMLNSALNQIKSELKNKSAAPDCTMTAGEKEIQANAIKLLADIKFCISIKEWIQIRAKAKPTETNLDWRDACAEYTTKMKQYIKTIKTKTLELFNKYSDLSRRALRANHNCKNITDTINLIELKQNDLGYFTRGDDELSDKYSIISNIKKACEEILKESDYLTTEDSNKPSYITAYQEDPHGYMVVKGNKDRNPEQYITSPSDNDDYILNDLPGDAGYEEIKYEDPEYITAVSVGGRKYKKKTRSKFRRGKKRLTRK